MTNDSLTGLTGHPGGSRFQTGSTQPLAKARIGAMEAGGATVDSAAAPSVTAEVDRYLRTGETDPYHAAWLGSWSDRAARARRDLRSALVLEVGLLASGRQHLPVPKDRAETVVRPRLACLVRGLFPPSEREAVAAAVERSVIFVVQSNIERLLLEQRWDHTAWNLANLYLDSLGAVLLSPDAQPIVGLSEETTFYVSPSYFERQGPFADFVVHEVAHIFHNCKRATVGLPESRRREWLLNIAYSKREEFAYSCEAYSRILEAEPGERRRLVGSFDASEHFSDHRIDVEEVTAIVREAAGAWNGWRVILRRCAPGRPRAVRP